MATKVEQLAMPQVQVAKAIGVRLSTEQGRSGEDTGRHASSAAHSSPVIEDRVRSIATMFTYFIQREDGGPIKIGRTEDIRHRLRGMQTSTPVTLVCIAFIQGDHETELHERFHHLCVAGEWFACAPELTDFIKTYATPASISVPPLTPERIAEKRRAKQERHAAWEADNAKYTSRFKPKAKVRPWAQN